MNNSSNWLIHDHHKYDEVLDACETAAGEGDWKNTRYLFNQFVNDLKLHMQMEDEILYPLFVEEGEDANTVIEHLGEEHDYLVKLVNDLSIILVNNDFEHFLDSLEPLHTAMKQHNEHEEKVFLSMANQSILLQRDEILKRLNELQIYKTKRDWGSIT